MDGAARGERHSGERHSGDEHSDDRHSDDELASALEEEVARITSAIPIVVQRDPVTEDASGEGEAQDAHDDGDGWGGRPTELISFDDLPVRREQAGPEPTFSPWVATAAIPIQRAEPAAEPVPEPEPVEPPTFQRVARAEPLGLVPPELAPRDSEPVPLVPVVAMDTPRHAESVTERASPTADPPRAADDSAETSIPQSTPPALAPPSAALEPLGGRHVRSSIFTPESADLEPAPVERRVGRASRMFWLWFAGTSSLISVGVGATLFVLGLSLRQLLVATLVGVALSFLPLGVGTLAGKWSGQPTLVASRAFFGLLGNVIPTVLALVVKLFWGAVLLWLAGSAAGSLTGGEQWPGNAVGATSVALAATIVVAAAIAFVGYALVARVQLVLTIASAVLIALMVMATWRHVDVTSALVAPDAVWTHVVTGAVLVFSYVGLAWAMSSSERRCRRSFWSRTAACWRHPTQSWQGSWPGIPSPLSSISGCPAGIRFRSCSPSGCRSSALSC